MTGLRLNLAETDIPATQTQHAHGMIMARTLISNKEYLTPPWGTNFSIPADCTHVMINVGPNMSPITGDKKAFIILIDPLPQVTNFLKHHHASATTVVYQAAISNFSGHAEFHPYNSNGLSSSLAAPSHKAEWNTKNKKGDAIQVPVHTLRELLMAIPPGRPITLLKTDMQGYDLTAIKSAGPEIKRVERIYAEVYQDGFSSYIGVQNQLASHWLPYMEQVGFEKKSCKDAYTDKSHGYWEMDCEFHQRPAASVSDAKF